MHQYSVDYDRKIIYFGLAFISIALTTGINKLLQFNNFSIAVTGFTIFGLVFLLFDNWLWKIPYLHKLGLVKTPNLNGTWKGELFSSYHNFETAMDACIKIKQTWTKIYISGNFNQSKSYSISANLEINNGARTVLSYIYVNKNNLKKSEKTMGDHSGITMLEFEETISEGKYYNEQPQNKNYGMLQFKKETYSKGIIDKK